MIEEVFLSYCDGDLEGGFGFVGCFGLVVDDERNLFCDVLFECFGGFGVDD